MEITEKIIKIGIIFLFGFLSANIVSYFFIYGLENPFSNDFGLVGVGSNPTPSDFIKEKDIKIYDDKIIIEVPGISLSRYAPTVYEGDIITFNQNNLLIVHRVVEKAIDDEGVYFITKGDNNSFSDGKIRFKDIEYITIGVLY